MDASLAFCLGNERRATHWEGDLALPLIIGRQLWEFSGGGQRLGRDLEKLAEGLSEDDPSSGLECTEAGSGLN